MKKFIFTFISFAMLSFSTLYAQKPDINWYHLDQEADNLMGISSEKAYSELLEGKESSEIVVAILDSGVDINHEDLQGRIWVNEDEIAGNGVDDDNNGYVDDVNGWSFIGGKKGDVEFDNLEFTRIYKSLREKYKNRDESSIKDSEKEEYKKYLKFDKEYTSRLDKTKAEIADFDPVYQALRSAKKWAKRETGRKDPSLEEIEKLETKSDRQAALKEFLIELKKQGLVEDFEAYHEQLENTMDYMYNLDFDSRSIVGDNYDDITEKYYGNNNVIGPDADHGTHVAGIVAALRGNDLGGKGIATNVKIMSVRVVPNGDERDKDVANAIRYAVDNGAKIINMSFGKSYSPGKSAVDAAAKYAAEKGVLLVHAAGNSSKNTDNGYNFPNDKLEDGSGTVSTWIEVGSSNWQGMKNLASTFSNYGRENVDVFAPGSDIYSTTPFDEYAFHDGTSMASPVVAGVAALVWSYYPDLTALELKEILLTSAVNMKKKKVVKPGEEKKKTKFKKLSVTGSVINAYFALKMAALKP